MEIVFDKDKEDICAIATAPGVGGIAVIRVSGPNALLICRKPCSFFPFKPASHRIFYGYFKSVETQEVIDEVVVSYFAKGHSFTGEETVEISCHGGSYISQKILSELILAGARLADKGEFTYRAFMNGRIDLVQAESVLALIESQSKQTARLALRQLQGELSEQLKKIEDDLVWLAANLEANIDYAYEDIEVASTSALVSKGEALQKKIITMLESYKTGRILREGLKVAFAGQPNVGKSSLLNAFYGEERAIVTNVPGTTRDSVEAQVMIRGIVVNFVDTAGLRESTDEIEKIGIQRAKKIHEASDVVVFVLDLSCPLQSEDIHSINNLLITGKLIVIGNKVDISVWDLSTGFKNSFLDQLALMNVNLKIDFSEVDFCVVSAFDKDSLLQLSSLLENFGKSAFTEGSTLIQQRHFDGITEIEKRLSVAIEFMRINESPEFIAFELKEAVLFLHQIIGVEYDDQIMDRVFKEFCLGK